MDVDTRAPVILVVDDEGPCRELFSRYLKSVGLRTLVAKDGMHAVSIARRPGIHIDVVVSDLQMPGLSGLAFADLMAQLRPGLPMVLISGGTDGTDPEVRRRLDKSCIFLAKPFRLEALARAVGGFGRHAARAA